MEFRIGVNLCDVMVEGAQLHGEDKRRRTIGESRLAGWH
jgi:hypothetical protein